MLPTKDPKRYTHVKIERKTHEALKALSNRPGWNAHMKDVMEYLINAASRFDTVAEFDAAIQAALEARKEKEG